MTFCVHGTDTVVDDIFAHLDREAGYIHGCRRELDWITSKYHYCVYRIIFSPVRLLVETSFNSGENKGV